MFHGAGFTTIVILVVIAILLFLAARAGWISNKALETAADVAVIVALLAAIAIFIIPTPESPPSQSPSPSQTAVIVTETSIPTPKTEPSETPLFTLTPLLPQVQEINIRSEEPWQDTGVYVTPKSRIKIKYISGSWTLDRSRPDSHPYIDANGYVPEPSSWEADQYMKPLPEVPFGALIGKINSGNPFLVGMELELSPERSGNLFLQTNDSAFHDNDGSIRVSIVIYSE